MRSPPVEIPYCLPVVNNDRKNSGLGRNSSSLALTLHAPAVSDSLITNVKYFCLENTCILLLYIRLFVGTEVASVLSRIPAIGTLAKVTRLRAAWAAATAVLLFAMAQNLYTLI